jgi:hypothetical protein
MDGIDAAEEFVPQVDISLGAEFHGCRVRSGRLQISQIGLVLKWPDPELSDQNAYRIVCSKLRV